MTMTQNQSFITIDNKRFHYIWLRENCSTCRYTSPYQQLYDRKISYRPENPQPLSVELNEKTLTIDWKETPAHRSVFSVDWLIENSYDPGPQLESDHSIFWDKATLESRSPNAYDARTIDRNNWMEALFRFGFVLLENMTPEELEPFLLDIGPIYNAHYGKIVPLQLNDSDKKTAYSSSRDGCPLPVHNDLSYWGGHRLVQFIHCIEHNNPGGASILVDGFRVASDFREDYPEYFQLLVDTPVQFLLSDQQNDYRFCNIATILECDRNGNLETIRFNKRNCRPQLSFTEIEEFYQAYNLFCRYLNHPQYQYQLKLEANNCLLFQNFRVLHGRTAFDPALGTRNLRTGYVDWNFFVGRRNFKKPEIALLR